ncbi:DUF4168 domain-containing protein [Wenxinia saemankumensis]|uniref:DUF4168 domain-containing protein n=1 Tax=Wenxinia saemankumensis TaxID=1447782 RepID=A0A1M6EUC1_9RHOB|nr:DUF4168 domain-containing protein [Wenxinia saemankumensis]SHI89085.1 protein of unknown function [Wenxinia saemankumensis]
MTTRTTRTALALTLAGAMGAAPLAALAQEAETAPGATTAPAPLTAAEIDDATLAAFADAVVAVEEIRASWEPRIAEAETADQQGLVEQAGNEMIAAIEDTEGLTLEEYVAVNEAAAQDPELAERILALLPEDMRMAPSNG